MLSWRAVSSTMPRLRFSSWHAVGASITLYSTVLLVGSAFFFLLHYLGNQIPYELAFQRLKEGYTEELPWMRSDHPASWFYNPYEFCQLSLTVLGGAQRDDGDHELTNAVLLKTIGFVPPRCPALTDTLNGEYVPERLVKTRYWWGNKALYAIALRHISISSFNMLIGALIYAAHFLLAGALLLTSRRTFFIVSPVLVFSLFLSNAEYFQDAASGLPYIWALLAVAATALLSRFWERAIPMFCFIAGMVSSYLWQFDGHTLLLVTLFVLIGWFGNDDLSSFERLRRTVLFTSFYTAGFLSSIVMMQVVKMLFHEYAAGAGDTFGIFNKDKELTGSIWDRTLLYLNRMSADVSSVFTTPWLKFPIVRNIYDYWSMGLGDIPSRQVMTLFSGLALTTAAVLAGFQARRGKPEIAWGMLMLCGLILVTCINFVIPNDIRFRESRYVFLLLALCWSCLSMALTHMHRRTGLATAGAVAIIWLMFFGWHGINAISIDILTRRGGTQLEVNNTFDIYYNSDRLIYVRENCFSEDVSSKFFLHIDPSDPADLPEHRMEYSFDNLDFFFWEHRLPLLSERRLPFLTRCAASIDLPQYGIESIRTGQYNDEGAIWNVRVTFEALEARNALKNIQISGSEPIIRSNFDVHLDENRLVYTKSPCAHIDRDSQFFLHIDPVDVNKLPDDRLNFGFDNLDFKLTEHGVATEDECVAVIELPSYPILEIRTGQFNDEGQIWNERFVIQDSIAR